MKNIMILIFSSLVAEYINYVGSPTICYKIFSQLVNKILDMNLIS